ncbi:Paf1 complex component [Coemansia guatemalensis]|uniref:Paf1 complex component n=1 Tax=Coemansia guatemalensis TaxID=2761395 RepID=A0A9W8I283_9FUNG|nr:Paf1 complex component [Coemansia guatemalensis]
MSDLFGSSSELSDIASDPPSAPRTPTSPRNGISRQQQDQRSDGTPPPRDDLFGSDEDEDATRGHNGNADNLFGSDEEEEIPAGVPKRDEESASERGERSDEEEGEDESREQVRVMSARVPVLPTPNTSQRRYVISRTPNILQLEPTPFSADTYEDILEEEHRIAEKHGYKSAVTPELASATEGMIANTVRWRHVTGPDGKIRRESNARLVRWSDGSTTLVIGGRTPETYGINAEQLMDTDKEQHYYAAAHYSRELLMQSHARLAENWLLRPSRQSAQARSAVSLLLDRVRGKAAGEKSKHGSAVGAGASRARLAAGARAARTRFMVLDEDPELRAKREEQEEEKRERQRKREERMRERKELRMGQTSRSVYTGGDYSDEDREPEYASVEGSDTGALYGRSRAPRRIAERVGGTRPVAPRAHSGYVDEDDDGFIVDDDAELEVGPRDEFDEEEEEELAAQQLKNSKHVGYDGDESDGGRQRRGRDAKPRRALDSDDSDDDIDDF